MSTYTKKVVEDGYRNAVITVVGIIDAAVAAPTQVIQILKADFTNNDPTQIFNGFRINRVQFTTSGGAFVELLWDATADVPICAVTESNELDWAPYSGLQPAVPPGVPFPAGYTGDINVFLNAPGAAAATQQCFTLIVSMVKIYTG